MMIVLAVVILSVVIGELNAAKFTLRDEDPYQIFPGTKWCGNGNIAVNYDDLGEEKEADMCCRDHDHCPDFIAAGGTKYGLTNNGNYTRLSCKCDDEFRKCLKNASTDASNIIGLIYFEGLQSYCFKKVGYCILPIGPLLCLLKIYKYKWVPLTEY